MSSCTPEILQTRRVSSHASLVVVSLLLAFVATGVGLAEERRATTLDWETGAGKSYVIPAAELAAFVFGLNQVDRHFLEKETYASDGNTIWRNLQTAPVLDQDAFNVNQLGHPYQGSVYHSIARSTGLSYWESLGYAIAGSFLWETAGERTPPSANDHVATGIGGTFLGEVGFRMASLLLENGGEHPGVWRELGALVLSPATAVNRLVFGDRFRPIFPSHDPAVFVRVRLGAMLVPAVTDEPPSTPVSREQGIVDFSMTYGLPGKPGYSYTRPFDYFLFEFTAAPTRSNIADAIENVTVRGLLAGTSYEWGDDYRGLWGLFGAYDYLSPEIFRVATTSVSLGTVGQWWLSRTVALQASALGGVGFGAAGTVADRAERDYRWAVLPQALLGLSLIFGDRAMLEANGRQYFVVDVGSGGGVNAERVESAGMTRANVGVTVRLFGPHGLGVHYTVSTRDARGLGDRHQSVETVTISYTFLGHTRFGAVEWRPEAARDR